MNNPWKTIKRNIIYSNKYGFTLRDDDVINPKGGVGKYMVMEHPGDISIVALTKDNKVVLERQWRYPIEEESLEIPAGAINKEDAGKPAVETAKRELLEETGGTAQEWIQLGTHWEGNGFLKIRAHQFLALGVTFDQKSNLEDTEKIEIELVDFDEVVRMTLNGEIQEYRTQLAILLAKEFLERKKIKK